MPEPEQEKSPDRSRVLSCAGEDREPSLAAAVAAVRSGACVVLPTDTVYGVGADAFSATAVNGLLAAKGRGRDMPPPVLIGDPTVLMALGRDIPDAAKKLAERFWPGPLTLILQAQTSLSMDLGETHGTIAVRVPDHEIAREFLRATGPLAVSSANRTGEPAAVTAFEAQDQLGDSVAVYLDGGATPGLVPSTIVDFTASDFGVIVRAGKLTATELRDVVPYLEERQEPEPELEPDPEPQREAATTTEPAGAPSVIEPGPDDHASQEQLAPNDNVSDEQAAPNDNVPDEQPAPNDNPPQDQPTSVEAAGESTDPPSESLGQTG
ncbi:MAG: L-threonylcarbamoyladenylate synthase [Propionibacteriaceae bacterium]|nr:L-threonylcarbamoyladenylate synthase [Propionibacteriaceae bacterium]